MQILSQLLDKIDLIEKIAATKAEAEHKESNAASIGLVRGGSSGALTSDGKSFSTQCARKHQARLMGRGAAPSTADREAFAAGFGHELRLEKVLGDGGAKFEVEPDYQVLDGDMLWSGRPDFDVKELGGIEAKSLISQYSVYKAFENNWPQMKHVIQSAAYMTMLNRDTWLICIGNYFHANLWVGKQEKKFPPQRHWYAVGKNASGEFTVMNDKRETLTLPFKDEDIIRYYSQLQIDNTKKVLGARPHEEELKAKSYSRCDARYCSMSGSCDAYDKGSVSFDEWMQEFNTPKRELGE